MSAQPELIELETSEETFAGDVYFVVGASFVTLAFWQSILLTVSNLLVS